MEAVEAVDSDSSYCNRCDQLNMYASDHVILSVPPFKIVSRLVPTFASTSFPDAATSALKMP